ncbi:MAG: hypothetical protein J6C64_04790 [Lachnospiraceae bacterium]|nr:hypothetical protein [Lachnospiraceae bacterium]
MGLEKRKWQSCVTAAVFCILIFGFTVATLIKPSTEFSETENRVLAQKPEAKPETVLSGEFEEKYEEYLTDQFILRNHWIGIKTAMERLLLKRESRDIYFADDDYLIEKHTGVFTTQMARRNITKLAEFTQLYAEQLGAGHVSVLIIPNAVDILEDKLPPFACAGSGNAYLKQISETLPEETWFDASQILQMHKNEELYYRTDHHWKTLAAFYVYQAWAGRQGYAVPELEDYEIKTVTDSFEGTIQSKLGIRTKGDTIELFFPENEFSYVVKKNNSSDNCIYDYDFLNAKDKYAVYFGGNEPFLQICTEADTGRKILVIKDSYANCFIPFMLEEFQEIDILDLRYSNQRVSELIEEGKYTDLLILYNASGFAQDMSITKLTQRKL